MGIFFLIFGKEFDNSQSNVFVFHPFGLSEGSCGSPQAWALDANKLLTFHFLRWTIIFNLSIHINFTYPLLLAKLYLQQHLFCLRRLSYFLSLFYYKFYSNFALRVKKKCGSLVTYKVSLQCRECLILNLHRTWWYFHI